jgi:hypothetical protein
MKSKLYTLAITLFILGNSQVSQAQTWEWITSAGGEAADLSTNIARDEASNLYVGASFSDSLTINNTTYISQGVEDGLIIKLDSLGNILNVSQISATGKIIPIKIDVDTSGNIVILGEYTGVITLGTQTLFQTGTGTNFFICKFTNTGIPIWANRIVLPSDYNTADFKGIGIDLDQSGNVYVAGSSELSVTINNSFTNLSPNGSYAIRFASATGGLDWLKPIGNSNVKIFMNDVAVTPDGTIVYIGGYEYQSACFGCAVNGIQDLKVTIYKYAANSGITQGSFATGTGVAPFNFGKLGINLVATNTEIYVAGEFLSSLAFGATTLSNSTGGFNTKEGFVAKYSGNSWQWAKLIGGPSNQDIQDIALSQIGGSLFVTGSFEGSISVGNTSVQTQGQEAFVAEYDLNGNFQVIKKAGNGSGDLGQGVVGSDDGDVFVSGNFLADGLFDGDTITSVGLSDVFIAKLGCIPAPIEGVIGDTITCLESKSYFIVNPPGPAVTYNWTLSGGGTLNANNTAATINWTTTGIHTLTATPTNDCGLGGVFVLQIRVLDIPQQPTINGDATACVGSETYNINNVFGENYAWALTGGGNLFPLGNTAIINWGVTGTHTLSVTPSNQCGIGQGNFYPINVKEIPSQPAPIVGNSSVCLSTQTYSVPTVTDVNYNWSLSSGGTIATSGNIATINWTTSGQHTLTVSPSNDCGLGSSRSITITVNEVPMQPSSLVGNTTTCIGTETYSVVGAANTNYTWTLSSGGIISNLGASATIIWTTAGTHTLRIIPSNICGNGTARTVTVLVENVPTQPTAIIGLDTVCLGTQIYTIPQQQGVNYTWSLSGGGTIIPSANSATIDWSNQGSHTVTVTPYNNCGTGVSRSFVVFVKNINPQFTTITGEDTVCQGVETYNVASVNGLNYNWSLSGGGNLTALGNSAFVDWSNTGLYTLTVATSDGCSNSLTVDARDLPTQPSPIVGDTVVCLGTSNYSITPQNEVDYVWTLSGGGILTQSNFAATVDWTNTGIYTLSIIPSNLCGNGIAQTLIIEVKSIPTAPNAISGDTLVCLGNAIYNVNIDNSVNYNWLLTNSGAIISTNNNIATIDFQTVNTNILSVTASNICGTSPITDLDIEIIDLPNAVSIAGNTSVCLDNEFYSISTENYATYNWTLSNGGILNINNDTAFIDWTTVGLHQLSVTPTNQCGSGVSTSVFIKKKDIPTIPTAFTGDTVVCQGIQSYSVANAANTNYSWSLSGGGSVVAVGNSATINWTTAGSHTLTITPSNECGTGISIIKTIQVIGIPSQPTPIIGNNLVCLNTETYSVINQPDATYNWTLSGGGTIIPNGNSATVNWTTPGIYTITISPSSICGTGTGRTITVTVGDLPSIPQLNAGDTSVCLGAELYSVNPISQVTNNWTLSGGGALNAQSNTSASVNWTTPGNYTITIVSSNYCGTGQSLVIPVSVKTIPSQVTAITGDTSVCLGGQPYTIAGVSGETYNWSLSSGGNLSALSTSATVNWFGTGTHTLSVTPSNSCGVGALKAITVQVNDLPSQPTSILGDVLACEGQQLIYDVNAVTGVNYNWSVNAGGSVASVANEVATIDWTAGGVHTISVTPTNICGTGLGQILDVEVRTNDLTINEIDGDTLVCKDDEVFYTLDFDDDLSYEWLLSSNGDLTQINNSAVIKWEDAGAAQIAVVPSSICGTGDTAFLNVTIKNPLSTPTIIESGDSLIANVTEGLKWYVNEELIPITERFIIPQLEGIYTITGENICGETGFSNPVSFGLNETGLYVYPNPASKQVTLHYPAYLKWYYFDIIDFSGKIVRETEFYNGTNEVQLDIRRLDSGIYLVRSYTELGYFNIKLIVQN